MRGIHGVNDGQQIFSYDADFKELNNDEVKSLFTYQHPSLEGRGAMTEELALTMPRSFTYRRLESGTCALAMNTYLGRDYMGSAGRFGNHLSHVVLFHESDNLRYPAEYFGSETLRTEMRYEEVNNPNPPAYLPTPELTPGYRVDIDAVLEFLGQEDRLETYQKMLYCMLGFESQRKRLVICDSEENIILWIAALEYALPLHNAMNINFSTYDFDPSLSASQICGVVQEGTRYNEESHRHHFVFDLYQNRSPEVELEPEYMDFMDFIDTAMSLSYDSLQDFHAFLNQGYCYEKADEELYAAYHLYTMLSDGMGSMTLGKLDKALRFADEYALPEEKQRIVYQLMQERELLLQGESDVFLRVAEYLLSKMADMEANDRRDLTDTMVDRMLWEFTNDQLTETEFTELFRRTDALCASHGIHISTELMKPVNSNKLFSAMGTGITPWKISFVLQIIANHIHTQKIPVTQLAPDMPLGQTYYGIIHSVYAQGRQHGFLVVTKVMDAFAADCADFVNMGLNLEGMLLDLPDGAKENDAMWDYFGKLMLQRHSQNFGVAYRILGGYHRFDQVHLLYKLALSQATDPEQKHAVFMDHRQTFLLQNRDYAQNYTQPVFESYYAGLQKFSASDTYELKYELFGLMRTEGMVCSFSEELVKELARGIPLSEPTRPNSHRIQELYQYLYHTCAKDVTGRLLLLYTGISVAGVRNKQRLEDKLEHLREVMNGKGCDLHRASERAAMEYFAWVLPNVLEICDKAELLEAVCDLFDMPAAIDALFFGQCARYHLKQTRAPLSDMCEFLKALFHKATEAGREEVAEVLRKMNKQRLDELDKAVKAYFADDEMALKYWDEIMGVAGERTSVLQNLAGLFKRRKD